MFIDYTHPFNWVIYTIFDIFLVAIAETSYLFKNLHRRFISLLLAIGIAGSPSLSPQRIIVEEAPFPNNTRCVTPVTELAIHGFEQTTTSRKTYQYREVTKKRAASMMCKKKAQYLEVPNFAIQEHECDAYVRFEKFELNISKNDSSEINVYRVNELNTCVKTSGMKRAMSV